jgi:hypothetical protein
LWALALLLAILNAGMFVESASSRVPALVAGRQRAFLAGARGLVVLRRPASSGCCHRSQCVTGLALITLAGHAWTHLATRDGTAVSGERRPVLSA